MGETQNMIYSGTKLISSYGLLKLGKKNPYLFLKYTGGTGTVRHFHSKRQKLKEVKWLLVSRKFEIHQDKIRFQRLRINPL